MAVLVALAGCASSPHRQAAAPAEHNCWTANDCEAALTALFGHHILLPRATNLELVNGALMEPPTYVPLGDLRYRDGATNVGFDFSIARAGAASQPLSTGCAPTPVHRALASPTGRVACYQHLDANLSTQFFHDGFVYTVVVTDPTAPRGTGSTSTTRWLARLIDSYS